MKENCEIVRDLLSLYLDDCCSEASRNYVESHLNSCEACTQLLESMHDEDLISQNIEVEDARIIQNISSQWRNDKIISVLKGAMIVSYLASLSCLIGFQKIGSFLDADGFLHEPFYLIILFYGFLFLGLFLNVMYLLRKRMKKKRILK